MVFVIQAITVLEEQHFQIQLMEQQAICVNQEDTAILDPINQHLVPQEHSIQTLELSQKLTVLLVLQVTTAQDLTLELLLMATPMKQANATLATTVTEELHLNINILLQKVITLCLELLKKLLVLSRSIILTLLKVHV